ncbi:hypothetical protein LIER_26658 [Lithospermum erythrorhizon]|uniref:Secreted protein n=1 Tax=Lithospermum erythrorhizon TaxID=34254 RepID=A0AAV3RB77_LITER
MQPSVGSCMTCILVLLHTTQCCEINSQKIINRWTICTSPQDIIPIVMPEERTNRLGISSIRGGGEGGSNVACIWFACNMPEDGPSGVVVHCSLAAVE